mgnify:CR=1 FL=1
MSLKDQPKNDEKSGSSSSNNSDDSEVVSCHFCGDEELPDDVNKSFNHCQLCAIPCCSNCVGKIACLYSGGESKRVYYCDGCLDVYCSDCVEFGVSCSKCGKSEPNNFCHECASACEKCGEFKCPNCVSIAVCDQCGEEMCEKCEAVGDDGYLPGHINHICQVCFDVLQELIDEAEEDNDQSEKSSGSSSSHSSEKENDEEEEISDRSSSSLSSDELPQRKRAGNPLAPTNKKAAKKDGAVQRIKIHVK